MTPSTLVIDRIFRGVGRIKKRSGTTVPALQRRLDRMLTALFDEGRLDILRAIRDGKLTLMEVHDAYQKKALDKLPMAEELRPLGATMAAWVEQLSVPLDCSAHHKASLVTSRRYLGALAPKASLAELPAVLERLRDSLGKAHPRSFNLARAAALAFVRARLKRNHPLWLAVAAVEPRKVAKTAKRRPLTPDAMRGFFPAPESDPLDAIAWGMVTTGMHAQEYWGSWSVLADRVAVAGTKRSGRVRDVPLVMVPPIPTWEHRRTFEDKFRERTREFTPYDLRRTYSNWMESAGIPRTRRRLYMGHGAKDVTDLYEQHEVAAYLVEDAKKLRAWLGLSSEPALRLQRAK